MNVPSNSHKNHQFCKRRSMCIYGSI